MRKNHIVVLLISVLFILSAALLVFDLYLTKQGNINQSVVTSQIKTEKALDNQGEVLDQFRQLETGDSELAGYSKGVVVSGTDTLISVKLDSAENPVEVDLTKVPVYKWERNLDIKGNLESWSKRRLETDVLEDEFEVGRTVYLLYNGEAIVELVLREI